MKTLKRWLKNEDGASLVEYILLVALIAIICIVVILYVGHQASVKFGHVGSTLANSPDNAP